jgi:hypothetical protein
MNILRNNLPEISWYVSSMLPTLSLIVLVIVTRESIFASELAWLSSLFSIASMCLKKESDYKTISFSGLELGI